MTPWPTIIAIIGIFFVCIAMATVVEANETEREVSKSPSVHGLCLTPQCIYAAARILARMNSGVKPCDDFYEIVPSSEREQETRSRIRRIVEEIDEFKAPRIFSNLRKLHRKCIEDELMAANDEPMDKLSQQNINWAIRLWRSISKNQWSRPLFDGNVVSNFILSYHTKSSVYDHSMLVFELAKDDTVIPWNFLKEGHSNQIVQNYLMFMRDVASYLGAKKSQIELDLPQVLSFEMQLAQYKTHGDTHRYHETTVGELDRNFPSWGLKQLFSEANDSDKVQIRWDLNILSNLNQWIMEKQSLRAFDVWVTWRISANMCDHRLGPYLTRKTKMLKSSFSGTSLTSKVWQKCLERVRSNYPFLLNVLYYGQYLMESAVKDSKKILTNVRLQYSKFINETQWLAPKTKKYALEKIEKVTNDIGIFDKFMLDKNSNASNDEVKLSDGFLADNRANLSKILLHLNPSSEETYNYVENHVMYLYDFQHIVVGDVTFTDAYYDVNRPEALNYGAFGYMVGHEVAHILDDEGRHYDKNGNLKPWWDLKSDRNFVHRSQCLVDQYKKYVLDEFGMLVNSLYTRNEDIADNVGAKAAYFAYDAWAKQNKGPEKQLPGLDYSSKQLFWISLATTECARYRPEYTKYGALTDNHSLSKVRINVPLSNLVEFANDFKCRTDSRMNPVNKCTLW